MLRLYDHVESVCCQKVRPALFEKGVDYEKRHVALESGESQSAAFLAVNPKGMVPVVEHDGRIVTESSIILEYIDEAFEGPALMPADPYWRARRRAWARRIDDSMHTHVATISFIIAFVRAFRSTFDTPEKLAAYLNGVPDPKYRDNIRANFEAEVDSERMRDAVLAYDSFIADMETALGDSPWLAGDTFSLADLDVIPYIVRLRNLQLDCLWSGRTRVADWLERVTSRESWRKTVSELQSPDWLGLMKASGDTARPIVERMLAAA